MYLAKINSSREIWRQLFKITGIYKQLNLFIHILHKDIGY